MSRQVRLVLVARSGDVLGALPEFEVAAPWWPDVQPVVKTVSERFRTDVYVLRLLSAQNDADVMGGRVTYAAELLAPAPPDLPPAPDVDAEVLGDHPLRARWARPGGVAATVQWADDVLTAAGASRTGPPLQVKSWNLSCVLRLPTAAGPVWCKSVPPFLAHEGTILQLVATVDADLVPEVLATDPAIGTALLGDVAGVDQWEAPAARLVEMTRKLVGLQALWAERVDKLIAAGLPDWRREPFITDVAALVARPEVRRQLSAADLHAVDTTVDELPDRFAALTDAGLPDTLVHGDFHAGNWRRRADASLVLLDWGDSGVGHPMLDAAAFLSRIAPDVREQVRAAWLDAWRAERPEADAERAAMLVPPVAALRQALVYQRFLDGIEPAERCYHERDVPRWLRAAITTDAGAAFP